MPSFTKKQVEALRERDGNVCLWHGYDTGRLIPQHRIGRGMGGSRRLNTLENAVLLDSLTNGQLECDAEMARLATARGIKVPRWVNDPARVPVFDAHTWQWWRLAGDTREPITGPQAMDMMFAVYGDGYQAFGWRT